MHIYTDSSFFSTDHFRNASSSDGKSNRKTTNCLGCSCGTNADSKGLRNILTCLKNKVVRKNKLINQPSEVLKQTIESPVADVPIEETKTELLTTNSRPDLRHNADAVDSDDDDYDPIQVRPLTNPVVRMNVASYEHDKKVDLGNILFELDAQTLRKLNHIEQGPGGRSTLGPVVEDGKFVIKNSSALMDAIANHVSNLNTYKRTH